MDKLDIVKEKFQEFSKWAVKGPLGVVAGVILTLDSIYDAVVDVSGGEILRFLFDLVMLALGTTTIYVESDMEALPYAEVAKMFFENFFGFLKYLLGRGCLYIVAAILLFSHSDGAVDTVVGVILLLVGILSIVMSQGSGYEEIADLGGSMFKNGETA